MPESIIDILREVNPNAIPAEAPPAAANYEPTALEGAGCASCVKFVFTGFAGEGEEAVPAGYCSQWEANVRGDYISNAFVDASPALDEKGEEVWDFSDQDKQLFAEVHLGGSDVTEEEGFIVKEVLRTGEWPVIPTASGKMNKPLRVVRDGLSNPAEGTISLSELVDNFGKAIERVQIPLSDDSNDHKNITRVNTGFVRDLWIVDGEGGSKLVAKMEFTEPEIREKVLRGTYADVSCGIPWAVSSRGKKFGAALEHVAITNRPFIDGLGPFLAASEEKEEVEVVAFGDQVEEKPAEEETPQIDQAAVLAAANEIFQKDGYAGNYYVELSEEGVLKVGHDISETTWTVPFEVGEDASVSIAEFSDWAIVEEAGAPEPAPRGPELSDLEKARGFRKLLLSNANSTSEREANMPLTREELAAIEMSDDTRSEIQKILDENAALRASSREADVDRRVDELKDLGLSERPGFLKFYRQVMLSDDGGPAAVVLSDDGSKNKESLTALQILDRSIEALKGSDDKVNLSDQALVSGSDNKPPVDAGGEKPSDEDRIAAAKAELGLNKK